MVRNSTLGRVETTPASSLTALAFYLPQFHSIPENDAWWGEGYTEWVSLRRARPWSRRHRVRRPVPPLGEYSLEDPAVMVQQWALARRHGLDGFAVWDYWFGGGRQLLQRPIERVLAEKIDFRYCLAWANHSWYDKGRNRLLCEQRYPGPSDHARYFERNLPHFLSNNYIRIDGRPVFFLFDPHSIPQCHAFIDQWQELARASGLPGIYFIADRLTEGHPLLSRLDKYTTSFRYLTRRNKLYLNFVKEHLGKRLRVSLGPRWFDFRKLAPQAIGPDAGAKFAPTVLTGWDTTPRHRGQGVVFENLDPGALRRQLDDAGSQMSRFPGACVLLLKSWNEWAEGNIMEPDSIYGSEWLRAFGEFRLAWDGGDYAAAHGDGVSRSSDRHPASGCGNPS